MGPVVADSTCLIGLERIARLDLLPVLFDPVLIPPVVEREFGHPLGWLGVEAPANRALVTSLRILVDDGEAEAIALAYERECRIILDDRHARSVARSMGMPIIGTAGVLIKAKQRGVISSLRPLLDELSEKGFRLSRDLREQALRLAGE